MRSHLLADYPHIPLPPGPARASRHSTRALRLTHLARAEQARAALPPRTQRASLPRVGQHFYDWCEAFLKLATALQRCAPLRAEAAALRTQVSPTAPSRRPCPHSSAPCHRPRPRPCEQVEACEAERAAAEAALASARATAAADEIASRALFPEVAMAAAEAEVGSEERALQAEVGSVNPSGGGGGVCLTTRIRLTQTAAPTGRSASPIPVPDVVHTTVAATCS